MTPYLKTNRLRLYAPCHRVFDIEQHVQWLSDKETMKYSGQRHEHHTAESQRIYVLSFHSTNNHYWEISSDRDNDSAIGTITAYRDGYNNRANLGLLIRRQSWGQGYGFEAWQAVMNWLFKDRVRKIEAGCYSLNIGMLHIFAKSGMTIEGERRSSIMLEDGPCDLIEVGKLNNELPRSDNLAAVGHQAGYQRDISINGTRRTRNRASVT